MAPRTDGVVFPFNQVVYIGSTLFVGNFPTTIALTELVSFLMFELLRHSAYRLHQQIRKTQLAIAKR